MKKTLATIFGILVGVMFICAGLEVFVWDFGKMRQVADSVEWPEVDGIINISTVQKHGKEFWPRVEYTYSVAGNPYTSHQISFDIFDRPGGQGLRESILARYPVGKTVSVYYDPENPAIAILEPGDYSPFYTPLLFAVIPFGGGLLTVWAVFRQLIFGRQRPRKNLTARMQLVGTAITTLLIYSALMFVSLESGPREIAIQAFGRKPLGVPNVIFVLALQTLLFLPVPFIMWHGLQIGWQAHRDKEHLGFFYLIMVGKYHPHLRVSQWICIGGVLYFVGIMAVWITYTAILGI